MYVSFLAWGKAVLHNRASMLHLQTRLRPILGQIRQLLSIHRSTTLAANNKDKHRVTKKDVNAYKHRVTKHRDFNTGKQRLIYIQLGDQWGKSNTPSTVYFALCWRQCHMLMKTRQCHYCHTMTQFRLHRLLVPQQRRHLVAQNCLNIQKSSAVSNIFWERPSLAQSNSEKKAAEHILNQMYYCHYDNCNSLADHINSVFIRQSKLNQCQRHHHWCPATHQ